MKKILISALVFLLMLGLDVYKRQILGRYRELEPMGGKIIITHPHEQVYRLLTASGLHRIIDIDKPVSVKYTKEGM